MNRILLLVFLLFVSWVSYAQPSTQANNIRISAFSDVPNSLRIDWSNGTGGERIVILKTAASSYLPSNFSSSPTSIASSLVSAFPADGAGGDLDGPGQIAACVFNSAVDGSGTTVRVTGLSANTAYTIQIYEHDGTGGSTLYTYVTNSTNPVSYRYFTASGTWTPPTGVSAANIQTWGGGGGGGSFTAGNGGSGGGGGAYSSGSVSGLTAGAKTVTVGTGGAGSINNSATSPGTDSWFGPDAMVANALVLAKGGLAGVNGSTSTPTNGGAAASGLPSSGGVRFSGGNGGAGEDKSGGGGGSSAGPNSTGTGVDGNNGNPGVSSVGGAGGAAVIGGGAGSDGQNDGVNAPVPAGFFPGGGGGGTQDSGTSTSGPGGNGLVTVSYQHLPGTLTPAGPLSAVSTTYGTASSFITFTLTGSALGANGPVQVTAPAGFEIADGTLLVYGSTLNYTADGTGALASKTVNVRLAATTTPGSYSGNISITSALAATATIATVSSTVNPKNLTITGVTANNKVYDRLNTASINDTPTLNGIVGGDVVNTTGSTPAGTFASVNVGTGIAVTVTGYVLAGANAGNYTVSQPTGVTADITPFNLTISGVVANNKPFDGNTTATVNNGSAALVGVISPDVVTINTAGVSATFASSAVGNGIVVTAVGYALSGADAGNYTVSQPTGLTANITALTTVAQASGGVAVGPTINTSTGTVSLLGFSLNNTNNTSDLTSLTLTTTADPSALFSSISLVSSADNTYDVADPAVSATLGTSPTTISFTGITGQTITSGGTFYYFLKVTLNSAFSTADPTIKISFDPTTSAITFTNGVEASGSVINTINGGDSFYTLHDDIAPNVLSINRQSATNPWSTSNGTSATSVVFRITFSENMQSGTLSAADFSFSVTGSVAGAAVTGIVPFTGTSVFDVTVGSYSGTGTLGLNYIDSESGGAGSVLDIGGNATITLPANPNGSFTGQTYSIVLPQPTNEAFAVTAPSITNNSITVSWNSTSTAQIPTHFLVLAKQSAASFPPVADGTPVVNGPLAQNLVRLPGANSFTFNSLSTGTSYDFIVYKYTLSPNNSADNIDFETGAPGVINGVVTPTGTVSSIILDSTPIPISSLLDGNPLTEKADAIKFIIYDDGQDPISPNVMTLHLNGLSQESVTFTLTEDLTLLEGEAVTGFTSSTGSVATAIYSGKGSTNTITLTSSANGNWNSGTTISYSPVSGNAQFLTLGRLQAIDSHPLATASEVVQIFNVGGNFIVPAGVTKVTVEAWGAGGSGGGYSQSAPYNNASSYGGGGGAYSRSLLTVTPGASIPYLVGAGGVAVPSSFNCCDFGVNGGTTTFGGTLVRAEGGFGGLSSAYPTLSYGYLAPPFNEGGHATAGIGDVRLSGGNGGFGSNIFPNPGGGGGSSAGPNANGSPGANSFVSPTSCSGCVISGGVAPPEGGSGGSGLWSGGGNGLTPGGGGGGVGNTFNSGAGANGQIRITYSAPAGGGTSDWDVDNSPFKFSSLVITQGSGNSAPLSNWTDILAGAELTDGTSTVAGTINPTNITFSAIPASSMADVGFINDAVATTSSKTYTLKVWLRNNLTSTLAATVDNLFLDFRVDPANLTYDDVTNSFQVSSRLIPTQPALESGAEQIQVVATQLDFSTNPNPTQFVQQQINSPSVAPDFTTFPVVRARDINGNTDLNFGGTITLSSAIALLPPTTTMTNGVALVSAPQYQDSGNGTLTASTAGVTSGISTAVTVNYSNTSTIIPGNFITPATFSSLNTTVFVQVYDFKIVDDNGSGGDGSPTRISQLVYTQGTGNDVTDWSQAISQALLFDGINPSITGTIGTNTITFSSINTAGLGFVADNTTKNYQLYITLRDPLLGTLPDDIDNRNFVFEMLDDPANITLDPLSSLFTGTEGTNSGASNIAVDVVASKLQFDTNPAANLLVSKDISLQPPIPVVEALDARNNRDLDYNSTTVTTTNSSALIMSNQPANGSIINGLLTFPGNFQFNTSGGATPLTLNVASTGPSPVASATSSSFTVQPGIATTITPGAAAPATISSLETNSLAPVTVFNFNINDDPGGTAANNDDGVATLVSSVVITANPANNSIANWSQAIAGASLEDGTNSLNAVSISTNSITFSGIPTGIGTLGNVPDNTTKNYSLKIYLNTSLGGSLPTTIDGLQFEFQVLQSNITLAANSTGIIAAQSATSGNNNVVDVTATALRFLSPAAPTSASLDTDIPGISVEAVDINNNRDLDFTGASGTVSELSNPTGATMTNAPVVNTTQFTSGLLNFASNFRYTTGTNGDDVTLTIKAGTGTTCGAGAICATSPMITLQSSFESSIVADPTFTFSPTLPYVNHQEPTDIQNTGTSLEIARMLLVDGSRVNFNYGGFFITTNTNNDGFANTDQDGAGTTLNSITIRITNPSNLRRIALYSGSTELGTEIDVTGIGAINDATPFYDFVFTASPLVIALDDNIAPISIRASFRGTSPEVTDGEPLDIEIISATLGTGSGFFTGPPAGTYVAGQDPAYQSPAGFNIVNVLATKLDFVVQPAPFAGINRTVVAGTVEAHDQLGLLDTNFNSNAILSAAVPVNGSFTFASGVLDLSAMQYGNPGDGTLTVSSGGLTSDVNNTVNGLPNVAVQCTQVDVLHVTTSYTDGGPGGVVTSPNLVGGTSNKVVFGFKFNAPHTVTTPNHPLVSKFRITFSQPTAGVFLNMRVYESTSPVFSLALPEVTTLGATVTQPTPNTLEIDYTGSPRDLQANPDLSYFLMVNIDINASGSTPQMVISVVDDNVDLSPTDNNIIVSNGTSFSNTFSPQPFTFAATFPPSLVSAYPAVGQSNVDPNQGQLELTFSVPVFTLDNQVILHDKISGATTVLPALNGQFLNGAGTVAQPIIFTIPPGTLVANREYYVTIAQGNRTNLTGIMDDSENLFPGISFSGTLFFKTSDFLAPKLLGVSTIPSASSGPTVTDITPTGATLSATFDKKGRAYFMVLATNSTPPTNAQIKGTTPYIASPVIARSSFDVNSSNPVAQFGVITPLTGSFSAGTHYVWMYAEAYAENNHVLTPIETTAPYGAAPGFAAGAAGPTLTFVAPGTQKLLNLPNITFCSNSFQILNSPIIISEVAIGQFFGGGTVQTLNMVLPAGFQFDVTQFPAGSGSPKFGTLTLQGTDFVPGSGSLGFLGNSILTIQYRNNGSTSFDKIIISGLRVIASGSNTGNIFRLGGNALTGAIIDGAAMATLSSFNAPFIEFDNSYSTNVLGISQPGAVVTAIPDNTLPQSIVLTPYIPAGSSDFGPSSFSGTGVNVNVLNLSAVTLDVPFNITITHTDQNGCISNNAVQYLVYDHNTGINITDALDNADQGPYCSTNTNFVVDAINSPTYGQVVRKIDYDNLPSHFMETATAAIPASANPAVGPPTQIINATANGGAWIPIIQGLPKLASTQVINTITYRSYTFDEAEILDANAISGGAIPDPYINFRLVTPFQGNTFYTGGSLGLVEFTGTYRNSSNTTVQVPRKQLVEFFIPAVPIVEVGLDNRSALDTTDPQNPVGSGGPSNIGTPVYCEEGGLIAINGFPAATAGFSTGSFTLEDAATNTPIVTGALVDNSNGTANLDPSLFATTYGGDPYQDIRIIYTYNQNDSPCQSSGSQIIRISPNPAASFAKASLITANTPVANAFCENNAIEFDGATSGFSGGSGGTSIDSFEWDFGDPNLSTGSNPNEISGPVGTADIASHTYVQSARYTVGLTVTSSVGCNSPVFQDIVDVGAIPVVAFDFDGVSTAAPMNFIDNSTVSSAPIVLDGIGPIVWDFGDATPTGSGATTSHQYANPNIYFVEATVSSVLGCTNALTQKVVMVDKFIPTDAIAYEQDFEAGDGDWQIFNDPAFSGTSSWAWGAPTTSVITNPINGSNIWTTNLSGSYSPEERSYLYTTCFDMTQLLRPMISFNSMVQLAEGDGVVVEYSTDNKNISDPTKDWTLLGDFEFSQTTGVDWYNALGLASKPGNQATGDYGWSGSSNTTWMESKHILDIINIPTPQNNVVFRFGISSVNTTPSLDGFALDNIRIGNRTRTILVENFTSKANPAPGPGGLKREQFESDGLKIFNPGGQGTRLVKINYHVGFPFKDPFNLDNPADPSARALYYNITQTPLARLDGFKNPGPDEAFFSTWGLAQYGIRTLQLAQAELTFTVTNSADGSLQVDVQVNPKIDLEANTVLHVAILEKDISLSQLSSTQTAMIATDETDFEYILKRMLPSALGTRFGQVAPAGQPMNFGPYNWYPDKAKMYLPNDDIAVIVFLQNEDTREILQSEILEAIPDPPLVTGLDLTNFIDRIGIYPNPADAEVKILLPAPAPKEIQLQMIDQMGRVVNRSTIEQGKDSKEIDTRDMAAGIYMVLFGSGDTSVFKKVMIVHRN